MSPVTRITQALRAMGKIVPLGVLLGLIILLGAAERAVAEPPQGFVLHAIPKALPEIAFADGEGRPLGLTDFRGRTVLLNVWATWCPPCVKEMPTLDRLQAELGGPGFEVVALSIDRAGPEVVRRFYERTEVEHLALYIDVTGRAANTLGAFGLPLTVLIDAEGRELGRLIGSAEWDTPAMIAFLRGFVAGGEGGKP